MNLITEAIKEMERQDRVNDIDLSGVVEILHEADKAYNKALTIPAVVVPKGTFYCRNKNATFDKICNDQCKLCKHVEYMSQ